MNAANDSNRFGSQELVWQKVRTVCDSRLCLDNSTVSILCAGSHGSGKTFTLVGEVDNPDAHGIIPRFVEYAFDPTSIVAASNIQLQMVLIYNEKIVDLFNPAAGTVPHEDSLAYSDVMGSALLTARTVVSQSMDTCLDQLMLGLTVSGVLLANSVEYLGSPHLVVSCRITSPSHHRVSRVIFAEVASLHVPKAALSGVDRLTGLAITYTSAREFYNSVKSNSGQKSGEAHESCVLAYILQDSVIKVRSHVD